MWVTSTSIDQFIWKKKRIHHDSFHKLFTHQRLQVFPARLRTNDFRNEVRLNRVISRRCGTIGESMNLSLPRQEAGLAICRVMRDIEDLEVAIAMTVARQTRGNTCLVSNENLIARAFIRLPAKQHSSRVLSFASRVHDHIESLLPLRLDSSFLPFFTDSLSSGFSNELSED